MAQCPNCGSPKVRFQREYAGSTGRTKYYRHHRKTSWFISSGSRTNQRTSYRRTIGLCQNCGYTWEVGSNGGSFGCGTILIILLIIGGIYSLFDKPSQNKENGAINKTVEVTDSSGISPISTGEIASEVWSYPTLSDFDYEFEDGGITLTGYHGAGTSIVIPSSYTVENRKLNVLELDDTFSQNKGIMNVAISDGVQTILSNTFYNCSNLRHLYIPSSVKSMSATLTYPENGEILYYGGNETQWAEFRGLTVERSDIPFKQIVLNATMDDCLNNINTTVSESYEPNGSYAPLSDFEYDYTSNGLVLSDYSGSERTVIISPSYTIDGEERSVVKLDNTFALGNVDAVIVPEGVLELTPATFNSCGLKRLYLPKSATSISDSFWGYFHDLDTLYYGGTEEEFASLCPIDRFDIDIHHIEYEATPEMVMASEN